MKFVYSLGLTLSTTKSIRFFIHILYHPFSCVKKGYDSKWVKECIDFVVEGVRPRSRPNRRWKKIVEGDVNTMKLSKEDALIRSKWRRID